MTERILFELAGIIVIGIFAQWLSWRLRLPAILILLLSGFVVGPVSGILNPQETFADLLFPLISISVAIILFEGGLSLRLRELKEIGKAVRNMISVGILITWIIAAAAAYYILQMNFKLAVLLGAILVVTGPTVIIPMLRHLRLTSRVGNAAKWEGIINDPIGAILAVLVFEMILIGDVSDAPGIALGGIAVTIITGTLLAAAGALILVFLMKKYWIPDYLQNPFTLMVVVIVFVFSNMIQPESGLFTVTLLGIAMANQKQVNIKHIIEFKENLRVLLISSLFIILAARLQPSDFELIDLRILLFLAVLIFIVRPAAVYLATIGSELNFRERTFLNMIAPRGIVAAAVASLFAFELEKSGVEQAALLIPYVFFVIIATVVFYGLGAPPLAKWLNLSQPNPQGILIVGAHGWARKMAAKIKEAGFKVLLVDTNWAHISQARLEGLPAHYGNVLSETIFEELDLTGLGRMIALTPNDEVNNLAALHFAEVFGRQSVYHLSAGEKDSKKKSVAANLRGRRLLSSEITFDFLDHKFLKGAQLKSTSLTETFNFQRFKEAHDDEAIPLFCVSGKEELIIIGEDDTVSPRPGSMLITLVSADQAG